jgi:hypothetical protein
VSGPDACTVVRYVYGLHMRIVAIGVVGALTPTPLRCARHSTTMTVV